MQNKLISLFLVFILLASAVFNCYADESVTTSVMTEVFVYQELFRQYSLVFDTFNAAMVLEDGTEITGIGFTDYSAYYEADDGTVGYFPAGFIADYGYTIPESEVENGLVIENLDFSDDEHQFIYAFDTAPFMEHCVIDGQYLKYGVDEHGAITYESSVYVRGVCDESLGALYSYDMNRFVVNPDVGDYIQINGVSLFDHIDYAAVEAEMNQIIAKQNANFSHQEVVSSVHIAQDAIVSYLLSMQEETFLGFSVAELVECANQLDPSQCIRITPDGLIIIDIIDETPTTADALTKWLVGAGCFIMVAGSIALEVYMPAARPLSSAIMGAAVDVFIQVVNENKTLENVQWEKVAVAATSGAMMAWACPLAASNVTEAAIQAGASRTLSKITGYGVLTVSNGLVAGVTNLALSEIDVNDDGWNAFLIGAAMGAAGTAVATVLSEALSATTPKVTELISDTKFGNWIKKTDQFIMGHQVHFSDTLENVLAPKSVHQAAECAWREINNQTGTLGGRYSRVVNAGDGSTDKHEMPSFSAYNNAKGITNGKRDILPAIKMDKADHRMTASYGNTSDAIKYRATQTQYIENGNMRAAIQMDIKDITSKFGTKYYDEINQMLQYAQHMGWW